MIQVVCGLIYQGETIFIARRRIGKSNAGKWEFPGGKVEIGEDPILGLQRELREELGMEVQVMEKVGATYFKDDKLSIELIGYKCLFISSQELLNDHDQIAWIKPEELKRFDLSEADIPFLKMIGVD